MAHALDTRPSPGTLVKAFASTNTAIVLDDTGTVFRVRVFTSMGDISTLTPGSTRTFTDAEVGSGVLMAYLKTLITGLA